MADLQFLITIPEAAASRPESAIAKNGSYQETLITYNDVGQIVSTSNPETKQEFATKQLVRFIKEHMIAAEAPSLAEADRLAKINEINDLEITVTLVT